MKRKIFVTGPIQYILTLMISKIPLKMNLVIAGWIGERIARLFKGSDTASRKMKVLLPSDPPAGYSYRKLMPLVFCDRINQPRQPSAHPV
jgi:hypothetical protein